MSLLDEFKLKGKKEQIEILAKLEQEGKLAKFMQSLGLDNFVIDGYVCKFELIDYLELWQS